MRPTRRGFAVLTVAVVAGSVSARYGQPGLSAIAGPLFVGVLAAAGQLLWVGEPSVERKRPRRGFPGETRTVRLEVDGSGIAHITDTLSAGLTGEATVNRSLPATITYDVTYASRGEHRIGPVEATVTDALGLVRQRYTIEETTDVLVYPPVYRLGGPKAFVRTFALDTSDRQSFDRLREYVPGDSLRDVHWKSSAKREEMLVKVFADSRSDRGLLVVAESTDGSADEMAAAAATLAVAAMEEGIAVAVAVPDGSVPKGNSDSHRTRLLEVLARTGAGETGRADEADVSIRADDGDVTITVGDRRRSFAEVTANRDNPLAGEVGG